MISADGARALSHPLRIEILRALAIDGVEKLSPRELHEDLEQPLGNVSYHVRTLNGLGLIRLVDKQPRRGAIEHYYALTEAGARLLAEQVGSYTDAAVAAIRAAAEHEEDFNEWLATVLAAVHGRELAPAVAHA